VARTEHALAEVLAADLTGLDLVALLVDGIRVADHTCVVALGIAIDGTKIPSPWPRAPPRTPAWSLRC
jgi:putative transposase